MTSARDPAALIGREVSDHQGSTLGTVQDVFRDATTGEPTWLALRQARLPGRTVLLPYHGVWARGDHLVSRWDEDTVRQAPSRDDEAGRPGLGEEQESYRHFGEDWSEVRAAGRAPYQGLGPGGEPVTAELHPQDTARELEGGAP